MTDEIDLPFSACSRALSIIELLCSCGTGS